MNDSSNVAGSDQPTSTADLVVAAETAALTRQTRIGRFRVSTDVLRAYTMVFALIAIWIFFHYSTDQIFLDPRNFSNLMRQTAVTGVLAVGMLMVIVTGQIDLSVGSVVGLAGGIAAIAQGWYGWELLPSLAAGISVAFVIGAFQGSLVAYLNVPAFIVTLGGLLAWRGVVLGLSRGETIPLRLQEFKAIGQDYVGPTVGWVIAAVAVAAIIWFAITRNRARKRHGLAVPGTGTTLLRVAGPSLAVVAFIYMMNSYEIAPGRYAGIPVPVIIFLAIAITGAFLTRNTTFGRYLYAIGGNPDAARLSGINIRRHLLAVFCIMGTLTGVAAIIYTARVGSSSPDAGQLLELDAIAACVIGGTSLMGGRGTVFGAILGALIMASLDNGMSLKSVEPYMQNIIKGAILVAAVGLDMAGRKRG
ncbi:MAG TPA: sugar ABC transporter permease [Pyrinomonadaceae bacterium]|nr:sugar ABC transporter permease [Pyrinomonadaceae bacterium]